MKEFYYKEDITKDGSRVVVTNDATMDFLRNKNHIDICGDQFSVALDIKKAVVYNQIYDDEEIKVRAITGFSNSGRYFIREEENVKNHEKTFYIISDSTLSIQGIMLKNNKLVKANGLDATSQSDVNCFAGDFLNNFLNCSTFANFKKEA